MASNKIAGIDVLLSASTDGGTTQNVIGGQSGATLNRSTNVIEVSSKDSSWTESIAGMKSWSIECEGFMVKDDAGLDALETAWENGDEISVSIAYGGNTYEGNAILSDFPSEFPQDDAVTFSISLTGTGALSKTATV